MRSWNTIETANFFGIVSRQTRYHQPSQHSSHGRCGFIRERSCKISKTSRRLRLSASRSSVFILQAVTLRLIMAWRLYVAQELRATRPGRVVAVSPGITTTAIVELQTEFMRFTELPSNPAASGNGAVTVPFHVGHPGRAVPEQYRYVEAIL